MKTLKEAYCLRKDDFSVSPENDYTLYAGRNQLKEKLKRKLEEPFLRNTVPKMYLWGPYGAGKTHTLYHVKYYLEKELGVPSHVVFMNIGIIEKKTKFVSIHKRILEAIGRRRIRDFIVHLTTTSVEKDLNEVFSKYFEDEDIGNIARRITFGGEQERLAWSWLCGEQLSSSELNFLSVPFNIKDPDKLVKILLKIGQLFKDITKETLIVLVDECEYVTNISDADAVNDVRYAIRELCDEKNRVHGVIFAGTAEEQAEIGNEIMLHGSVKRRMEQGGGYEELPYLGEIQVKNFIKDLLEYVRDKPSAEKKVEESKPKMALEWYPFTEDAIDLIVQYLQEDPTRSLPSKICEVLNEVAVQGIRQNKDSIDDKIVSSVLF